MVPADFIADYARLLAELGGSTVNLGCFEAVDCVACVDCMFSTGCVRCHASQYSSLCRDSYQLNNCAACDHCYALTFSRQCSYCAHSNYLISCSRCIDCDFCFGCVGLRGKDFHILNRPYSRKEYFRIVKELAAWPSEKGN